jgi:putative methionine-R-sulfoxide reductase with GAF domain
MDFHSILDHNGGEPEPSASAEPSQAGVRFPGEDGGKSLAEMAERDLTATLQLLAERARYITGASGAAIALRDHEEMVCRASAGSSAPEVGAQLQINSGLSGESVRTKQTLRCDDAAADERVNRESCEALGIRSVVVMPLLRSNEVIGVFELFSDQANIFETRDLAALERMGAMVHTALEHSAAALGLTPAPPHEPTVPSLPVPGNGHDPVASIDQFKPVDDYPGSDVTTHEPTVPAIPQSENGTSPLGPLDGPQDPSAAIASPAITFHRKMPPVETVSETAPMPPVDTPPHESLQASPDEIDILETPVGPSSEVIGMVSEDILEEEEADASGPVRPTSASSVPEPVVSESPSARAIDAPRPQTSKAHSVVASLRKCEACGFPVSEGRVLCLDCEKKNAANPSSAKGQSSAPPASPTVAPTPAANPTQVTDAMPNFLGAEEDSESWLATHKFMVIALAIAVLGIVAVVWLR